MRWCVLVWMVVKICSSKKKNTYFYPLEGSVSLPSLASMSAAARASCRVTPAPITVTWSLSDWRTTCEVRAVRLVCLVVVTNGYFMQKDESARSWYWLLPWLLPLQTSHRESRWLQTLVCWFGWNTYPENVAIELEHNVIPTSLWIQLGTQASTTGCLTTLVLADSSTALSVDTASLG